MWQFETLQEKDGLTNQREGCWGGCEFPVWLKAQIVVKGRGGEAVWVKPGTLGDRRQGCFPYRSPLE